MRLDASIDLAATLHGGQSFRWQREGAAGRSRRRGRTLGNSSSDVWVGTVGERLVTFHADGGALEASATPRATRTFFERYLRLGSDDAARRDRLARDPVLAPAMRAYPGLRLLRQDPWETTVAFLTSANNNVGRIEGILRALEDEHGEPIHTGVRTPVRTRAEFPRADVLARVPERDLRAAGLGYRAPFVRETARMVARGDVDVDALRGAPLAEVRESLLTLPGVGPKVADCIALFALDADDAFPIDRWVLRAMGDAFFGGEERKAREVETFARERWGRDAGLAQQYLFHAARLKSRTEAPPAWTRSSS